MKLCKIWKIAIQPAHITDYLRHTLLYDHFIEKTTDIYDKNGKKLDYYELAIDWFRNIEVLYGYYSSKSQEN